MYYHDQQIPTTLYKIANLIWMVNKTGGKISMATLAVPPQKTHYLHAPNATLAFLRCSGHGACLEGSSVNEISPEGSAVGGTRNSPEDLPDGLLMA